MTTCSRCEKSFGLNTGGRGLCPECRPIVEADLAKERRTIQKETGAKSELERLLSDGWIVAGYSTASFTVGVITHSVLLQKGADLRAVTVQKFGEKEVTRQVHLLT